jgi:alpha-mannosidase
VTASSMTAARLISAGRNGEGRGSWVILMRAGGGATAGWQVMVHRRCQHDDSRGVQEPLNETMCGCNDIGAAPGNMGAHGHEGDGGCDCEGLTVRGSMYLVVDTVQNAHRTRRQLVETLNFPPTLAFTRGGSTVPATPTMSSIRVHLPPNVKLQAITSNYAEWNEGQVLLRLAHLYQVDEHQTLSQPATFSLRDVFSKAGLSVKAATETMLTANQPRAAWEAKKLSWPTREVVERGVSAHPQERRHWLTESDPSLTVTINAMEVPPPHHPDHPDRSVLT